MARNAFIEMRRGLLRLTSLIAYDALKMAVERVLGKIKEGKKLSTEEVLVHYLGTIVNELKDVRSGVARLEEQDR